MANRYWVGGAGTWNTTSTTNWSTSSGGTSGASVPTAADSVIFDQAGTYTVTMTGALLCLDITVSAGVVTFATGTTPTLAVTGSMSLVAGTVWSSTGAITFNATTTGKTITTNGTTINGAITFNGVGGGWSLGSALVTGATLTTTLTNGALTLNGFDLSTGIFSSNVATARSVAFGANFINLITTTVGAVVVSMANSTLFSSSGTGGFKADASITRTYTIGTTGGSATTTANLFIPSGTAIPTITTASWLKSLVFTGSSTTPATATLNIAGNLTLSTGGTYTGLTINMVGTGTIVSTAKTIAALNINSTSGTTTLGDALTLVTNATTTITSGTLALNGFNLNTGIFTSSGTATRSILFGVGNILLTHTTAATTVLNFATATGFTWTGTGGFSADASITRTFTFGTTGGTTTNAPNLSLTGAGTAIATITTASWFNILNFGTTAFAIAATTLNLNGLTLSTGGTFTSLSMNAVGTGTITPNGKTIAAFTVNNGAGTVTLAAAFGCTSYVHTAGTINFATFNLTSSGAATFTAGTLSNIGTISCTTWTHSAAATFTLSSGTISASTSFTITSGSFNYNGGTITTPSFVHTAGTVTTTAALTLAATCTYTFTAGTITLGGNLSTGAFVSNNTNVRSIAWNTFTITLNHSTAGTTVLNVPNLTNYTFTGTQTFISDAAVTRTFAFGTTGATTSNTPDLTFTGTGASALTFTTTSWFDVLNFGTTTSTIAAATTLNLTGNLTLATGGTYTNLSVNAVNTMTITPNGKTIAALTINTTGTVTLAAALGCTTYTQTLGTFDFGTFNLTCSSTATYTGGTLSNIGTITCTTFTINGPTFNFTSGAINTSVSFVLTSGSFTLNTLASLGATPLFTHTAGSVTFNKAYSLTTNGQYTLTAGTLTLGGNLTTGIFASTGGLTRSVAFGAYFIVLTHTTPSTLVLSMDTMGGWSYTGTGGFSSSMANVRIFSCGNTTAPTAANAFNLFITGGSAAVTISGNSVFKTLDFTGYTGTPTNVNFTFANLILSSGGTYTGLTATSNASGSINGLGKTITTLNCLVGTTTLSDTLGVSGTTTINGGTITLNASGLLNTPGFVLTTGTANFGGTGGNLPTTTTFNHTAGTVNVTTNLTLSTTCTYTFTAGSINLSDGTNLTTGIFTSNNTNVRSIQFGTSTGANIILSHTSAGQTVLNFTEANNYTSTGPGAFVSGMSVTRTFTGPTTRFLTGSLSFNGTSNLFATPTNAAFSFGTGDYTVEFWIMLNTLPGAGAKFTIMDFRATVSSTPHTVFVNSSGYIGYYNGTADVTSSSLPITVGPWYHIAFSRISGTLGIYVNGFQAYSSANAIDYGTSNKVTIGASVGPSEFVNGYMSNIRMVKGLGVYTGNFTVPLTELTATQSSGTNINAITSGQTSLLLVTKNDATFLTDRSLNNFTMVNSGGVATNIYSPITSPYIGGSPPNLKINSGSSVPTLTTGCWFKDLDFTGSSTTPTTTSVYLTGNLTLSSGGTYTGLTATMMNAISTIVTNNKPLNNLFVNSETSSTIDDTTSNTITFSSDTTNITGNIVSVNVWATGTSTRTITGTSGKIINVTGNNSIANGASWSANSLGSVYFPTATMPNLTILSAISPLGNDFCLEAWMYMTNPAQASCAPFSWGGGGGNFRTFVVPATGQITVWNGTTVRISYAGAGSVVNTWNHIAVTKTASPPIMVLYWNGQNVGNYTFTTETWVGGFLTVGSDSNSTTGSMVGYLNNFRYVIGNPVYTGNFTPNTILTATQTASTNVRAIYSGQTNVLLTMSNPLNFFQDECNIPKRVENSNNAFFSSFSQSIPTNNNLTVTPTISMTSNNSKMFAGGGGTYGTLNQGGGGTLTIRGNNSFYDITTTANKGMNVTFQSGATQTFSNFNISGVGVTNGGPAGAYPLGSITFNGTSQYLTLPASPASLTFGAGDFTIECWCRFNNLQDGALFDARTAGTSIAPCFYLGAQQLSFLVNGTWVIGNASTNPTRKLTTDTWYHLAISKSGSSTRVFVDGVQTGATYTDTNTYVCGTPAIGHNSAGGGGSGFLAGTISNMRVVKGVGVYTGNFTVPVNPLATTQSAGTNIAAITGTQTSLLLNTPNSASFLTDTSSGALTVTNVGTVVSSSFQPFKVYINATSAGISAILSKSSGIVDVDNLYIQDSTATGGASWYAGAYSVNVSNNSGWVFSGAPSGVTYSGNFFAFF